MILDAIKARLARVAGKWPTRGVLASGSDYFGPKAWSAHGPLRCYATERGRARQWLQANADADFIAAAPTDIAALVAEVERLREEAVLLRELADEKAHEAGLYARRMEEAQRQRGRNTEHLLKGYATGKAEERAAIVTYLRERSNAEHPIEKGVPSLSPAGRGLLLLVADGIERKDHHKTDEEEP